MSLKPKDMLQTSSKSIFKQFAVQNNKQGKEHSDKNSSIKQSTVSEPQLSSSTEAMVNKSAKQSYNFPKSQTLPSPDKIKYKWIYPNIFPKNHSKSLYSTGPSLLDQLSPQSELNKSSIKGFYNLAVIFTIAFLITKPISKFLSEGRFVQSYLFDTFMDGYLFCMLTWPLFFLWSFTSFFLQKAILLGLNDKIALIIQHATQTGLFIFAPYIILTNDWCSSHAAFVILQACVHFMKMHSYTTVNRDYRQDYIQCKKTSTPQSSKYPNNINIKDFILFMFTPWLVYSDYPRKSTPIRFMYLLQKGLHGLGLIFIMYIIHTEYIMPYILMGSSISFFELILREVLPSTLMIIAMFLLIFQSMNNFFAELTSLDHRQFYEDWWNSTTFQQFNRKWNKPVHNFLFRHVYQEMIIRYKTSRAIAQAVTFTFSAVLHELLLAIIFRIFYPIFLGFIVFQIPLIYATKFMQGRKSGNYLFWFGIILGPTLIISIYLKIDDDVAKMFMIDSLGGKVTQLQAHKILQSLKNQL